MWTSVSDAHLKKARLLINQEKYALAEKELHQLLSINPDAPTAHALLGLCYLWTNRFPEAYNAAHRAIGLAPESASGHRVLSLIYEQENKFPEAEKAVRQAITLNPEHVFGYSLLGRILYNQKRFDEAQQVVQTGLSLDPENVACLNMQARIFTRQGEIAKATATFESSLKQDPEYYHTYANKGIALAESGDLDQAVIYLREAIRLNPDYEMAKRDLLSTFKAKFIFYGFVTQLFANIPLSLPKKEATKKGLLLFGIWLVFKVSPVLLPLYLILLHFNLYNEIFFNFIVSFNPEAKRLLLKEDKVQIKVLGGLLFTITGAFSLSRFTGLALLENASYILLCFTIPLVSTFYLKTRESLKHSCTFMYFLTVLAILYLVLSYFFPYGNPHAGITEAALVLFNLGLLGFCWFRKRL